MARARREGEAFVEVHADTDPFEREAEVGVRRGAERAEDDLKDIGDDWGETLTDSMGDRLEKDGPKLAKSVEKGIGKQKVKVPVKADYDVDRSSVKKTASKVVRDIEDAVLEAASGGGGRGGGVSKIGQAFSDAIGAGFNVSGKSPLIAILVPLVGVIIGAVGAAIQALNALAAVAITLPGILASVGIQVGVLMLAFHGMGNAIQGAFAAKNAKELKEALKDLAPAAQSFVKELLPLKDFFHQLQGQVQQNFFKELKGLITQLYRTQGPTIFDGLLKVSTALGKFFHDVGFFFNSTTFTKFLNEIFPRTVTFLETFGPAFITFLDGLLSMVNAAMPFLTRVGDIVSMVFKQLGDAMKGVSEDPDFQTWLTDMEDTLMSVINLFRAVGIFIGALFTAVDKAGGADVIDKFAEAIILLSVFLTSEAGIKGMTLLLNIAILSIQAFTAFIIVVLFALGSLQAFGEWVMGDMLSDIGDFFFWIGGYILGFFETVGQAVIDFWNLLVWIFTGGINETTDKFKAFGAYLSAWVTSIKTWFSTLPDRIKEVFSNAISFLYNAGKNIVQGLINGVKDMFGSLRTALGFMGGIIGGFLPHSPAKEGPLSGKGDPRYAGQEIVNRLAAGIEMETPQLRDASASATSNIVFGPNSIQMRINGPMDRNQARDAGEGVAEGIWGNLAARNTKLAIRTL